MNGAPLWLTIVSAIGGPTVITLLFGFVSKLIDQRNAAKKDRQTAETKRQEKAEGREAEELESFNTTRASVEAHIRWDYMIMARLQNVEASNNEMRVKLGMDPIAFPEIPPPPTFFTRPDGPSK